MLWEEITDIEEELSRRDLLVKCEFQATDQEKNM